MNNNHGFTLIELCLAMSIFLFIALVSLIAITSSFETAQLIEDVTGSTDGVRSVFSTLTREIELASTREDLSLTPPLSPITVSNSAPFTVTFQIPVDPATNTWSQPISYQFINEDSNGNCFLDDGEDVDGDGILNQRIVRTTTVGGQARETVLGAATNLSDVDFTLITDDSNNPLRLRVVIEASENINGTADGHITSTRTSGEIFLAN